MAFTNLKTSDAMNVGIIRNRGTEENLSFNDKVHIIINPYETVKLGDKVSFTYQGAFCEAEISQILYPEPNIIENSIEQNGTAAPLVEQYPVFKVRVFACNDYSIFPVAQGNECIIQASDITRLQPQGWSP